MWPEVAAELGAFRGLMILLYSDWWLPWEPCVLATDASEQGYAVAQSVWAPTDVRELGHVPEKSRWRLGAPKARARAAGAAGLDLEEHAVLDEDVARGLARWD